MDARWTRVGRWLAVLVPFGAAGAAAFAATLVVLLGAHVLGGDALYVREFDAALWNHPDWRSSYAIETGDHSIRQQMVDDLLATHLHVGMTRDDVLALLGPDDETAPFPRGAAASVYWLGAERGFPVDSEWLLLDFDAGSKLARARLATD